LKDKNGSGTLEQLNYLSTFFTNREVSNNLIYLFGMSFEIIVGLKLGISFGLDLYLI